MFRSLYCQSVLTTERYNSTMAYYDQHQAYAGSAIAQDAGRLDRFNRWRPGGKDEALTKIRTFFNSCKREGCKAVLY